ncbi:MAG: HAD family hydrolase [Methanobacteriaceae archaeon]|nr:HAD family hydrolase [Methanobacteriaceae archaeon]
MNKNQNKKAVVFDNSGTLIERYRVIKDLSNDGLITHINSMTLIDNIGSAALAILQFNTGNLKDLNPDMLISDLIDEYNIEITVSYCPIDLSDEEIMKIIKNDNAKIKDISDCFPILKEKVPNMELCNGSALILDLSNRKIGYTITSAGQLFPNVKSTIATLQERGIEVFIASGDRSGAIAKLTELIGIDKSHGFATASTKRKGEIVKELKNKGYKVMMVGDGPNDIKAFENADIATLTIEQKGDYSEKLIKYADYVIEDISKILEIDF